MTLSTDDGKLFYKLWMPLLDYVNRKMDVNPNLPKMEGADRIDPADAKEVANTLWNNVDLIDEYLAEHEDIIEEEREILSSWKRRVKGRFVFERNLKKGAILICMEDQEVYQVIGIMSSWEEMFYYAHMPVVLDATIIPFKDVIIPDGLLMPLNIIIGGNAARIFKDAYMQAKKGGKIRRQL